MVTDYEAAWTELAAVVAAKTQHGREGLLTSMAEIAARHQVPAGDLSRLLRLYGVEVERVRSISTDNQRDGAPDFAGGPGSPADVISTAHHRPGGHDVDNGRAGLRSA